MLPPSPSPAFPPLVLKLPKGVLSVPPLPPLIARRPRRPDGRHPAIFSLQRER
jgi:hypothetical protein